VRVPPNSGCCGRRGAALLALSVSVRGQRAAAAAAITVARRYPATIVSFSLDILTPLRCRVGDIGLSLLPRTLSVPVPRNYIIGWWLVYSCGFQELEGSCC
jgi:hypothetical protein